MNSSVGFLVVCLIYIGAAAIGVSLFGEGGFAAWFAVVLGGVGLYWLGKNTKED